MVSVCSHRPVCLRSADLLPLTLAGAGEGAQAERLMYRLCGMYLAVLSARKAAEEAARLNEDAASAVFSPARGRGHKKISSKALEAD